MGRDGVTRESAGELALTTVGERRTRLKRRTRVLRESPTPEAIHQFRVAARRLRAALVVFEPVLPLPHSLHLGPLRRAERRFGRLRDADVLREMLARVEREHPGLEAVGSLWARLGAEQEELLGRAEAQLERPGYRRLLRSVQRWLRDPPTGPQAGMSAAAVAPDLVLPLVARTLLHPAWQVERVDSLDDPSVPALHDLRRQVKSLRYGLECVAPVYADGLEPSLMLLRTIQDGLGAFHDHIVLIRRLQADGAPAALTEPLVAEALAGLESWTDWRALGADPGHRAAFRRRLCVASRRRAARHLPATVAPASAAAAVLPDG